MTHPGPADLIAAVRDLLTGQPSARPFADGLAPLTVPEVEREGDASSLSIADGTDWVPLATDRTRAAVQAAEPWIRRLDWLIPYDGDPAAGRGFAAKSAFSILGGPNAVLDQIAPMFGLFVVGPDSEYNDHRHGPPELYLPLAGVAEYWTEDGGWVAAPPGTAIVHPPGPGTPCAPPGNRS